MEESELGASSTLSEEERTAMTKVGKARASLCAIYDVKVKNLAEKNELGSEGI